MAGWAAAELPDAYGRSPSRFALGGFRAGRLDCIALVGRQYTRAEPGDVIADGAGGRRITETDAGPSHSPAAGLAGGHFEPSLRAGGRPRRVGVGAPAPMTPCDAPAGPALDRGPSRCAGAIPVPWRHWRAAAAVPGGRSRAWRGRGRRGRLLHGHGARLVRLDRALRRRAARQGPGRRRRHGGRHTVRVPARPPHRMPPGPGGRCSGGGGRGGGCWAVVPGLRLSGCLGPWWW